MNHINNENLKYQIKARIYMKDFGIGPGVAKIMELVKETENLSEVYRIMGLSSSKGWKMIKNSEEDLGISLIKSTIGGSGGGKSSLTPEGEQLLQSYQNFTKEIEIECEKLFHKHFQGY